MRGIVTVFIRGVRVIRAVNIRCKNQEPRCKTFFEPFKAFKGHLRVRGKMDINAGRPDMHRDGTTGAKRST